MDSASSITIPKGIQTMSPNDFATWLKGFMDAAGETLTPEQMVKIKEKLETVHAVPAVVPQYIPPTIPYIPTYPYTPITFTSDRCTIPLRQPTSADGYLLNPTNITTCSASC